MFSVISFQRPYNFVDAAYIWANKVNPQEESDLQNMDHTDGSANQGRYSTLTIGKYTTYS
jgi:hypothetical protein